MPDTPRVRRAMEHFDRAIDFQGDAARASQRGDTRKASASYSAVKATRRKLRALLREMDTKEGHK